VPTVPLPYTYCVVVACSATAYGTFIDWLSVVGWLSGCLVELVAWLSVVGYYGGMVGYVATVASGDGLYISRRPSDDGGDEREAT
jgi:hypothetical protein